MSQINESTIKTPGVYVNEIPSFPPSIAQVATAVPVFIGYTQDATKNGKSVVNQAVRISSLVQYVQYFGADFPNLTANVALKTDNSVDTVTISPRYQLYNAVRMFYNNGGINCYIISVGKYNSNGSVSITDFIESGKIKSFEVLRKEDEPTLIVIPDAILFGASDFNNLATTSLKACADLQDRFVILDVLNGDKERTFDNADVITVFRNGIGSANLNYGAAYYPWLRSSLSYGFSYQNIKLQKPAGTNVATNTIITNNVFVTQIDKAISDLKNHVNPFIKTPNFAAPFNVAPYNTVPLTDAYALIPATNNKPELQLRFGYIKDILLGFIALNATLTDADPSHIYGGRTTKDIHTGYIRAGATAADISPMDQLIRELILLDDSFPGGAVGTATAGGFATYPNAAIAADATVYGTPAPADDAAAVKYIRPRVNNLYSSVINSISAFINEVNLRLANLEIQLNDSSAVYNNITLAIKNQGIVVPPSGAMAGIYASVDGTRGVWKAPANVSVNTVVEPLVNIDDNMQEDLNIDTDSGKSVNAIRAFTGKGVLVWGARTLDGNSNDFRYISVRRFYIMVEESVKKAAMQFVFEPNDGNTWVRVRAMIENYLTNLWRLGALAGPKPEQAFYVKVGLGQTMTFDDILNGKMIIEIGMAPVRPAEFIILRFSQIQQQA
ncbi:phage tail sheath C-terminal domain-containing protein [Mucilaginibacter pocheonensis]|uniref:Phage tail sheath protein FI n=1 Tax=Mucilaginibacter pocheonensis TaxID=398050 RepID=A0ABU1TD61_9SPHI|nr:phage tail sheath C-terminal domain-containing protein [Mucilaginibacter pocheonensis]MDR6943330.1 phage tail sheath protein FI [Mucilaginibacter pocheonensis]